MKIFSELKRLYHHLQPWSGSWALCGGIAATLYRQTPRFTADIDVALVDSGNQTAEEIAQEILAEMQLPSYIGFVPDFTGAGQQLKAMICCREESQSTYAGIDFLLPVYPWLPLAVKRAQNNQIDYGFAQMPTITSEDLIIAKLHALSSSTQRPQDKDDVISVMAQQKNLDFEYLLRTLRELNIPVPEWISLK